MRKSFLLTAAIVCLLISHPTFLLAESNLNLFFKTNQQYQDVLVSRVISSDTVELDTGERIRMIGIRSPEMPRHMKKERIEKNEYGIIIDRKVDPVTSIEERAYDFTRRLLEGQQVRCEFDKQKTSQDNVTLAYIFLSDGRLANTEILRNGFAHLKIRPPNLKYAERLREAYREARREKRGLQGS